VVKNVTTPHGWHIFVELTNVSDDLRSHLLVGAADDDLPRLNAPLRFVAIPPVSAGVVGDVEDTREVLKPTPLSEYVLLKAGIDEVLTKVQGHRRGHERSSEAID
jgi:hypothetical protein